MLLLSSAALAERADENAVTAANDAFGTSTGYQSIGLYSLNDARGFDPQAAGNLRIEGLYFDLPSSYLSPCFVSSVTLRVGIAAQSYDFPAPTGIVDVTLFSPDGTTAASAVANAGSWNDTGLLAEGRTAISGDLDASACVVGNHDFSPDLAYRAGNVSAATFLRWRPAKAFELRPFVSIVSGVQRRIIPVAYTDGTSAPPAFVSRDLGAQDYTRIGWKNTIYGALANYTLSAHWTLAAGLFHALEEDPYNFNEEYLSLQPNRTADHVLDVVPPLNSVSTSGELRLQGRYGAGAHRHTLEVVLRGRSSQREFGGDALVDYGTRSIDVPLVTQPRAFATTAPSTDVTRQLDAGLLYEERWSGVGSLGFGVLRSHYRRTLEAPGSPDESGRATPWLPNAHFTLEPGAEVTLYGSYVQGLEDSALAPLTAVNRGEPPPATRSRQTDFGLRYAPREGLSVLLGGFEIQKPYFNLDDAGTYADLGTIKEEGVESSLSLGGGGFTLVAGAVWLHPQVTRALAEPGATGSVPIGPVPFTVNLNLDCAPPAWRPFAASLQLTRLSSRVATSDDAIHLPALTTLAAGVRYQTHLAGTALTVRLDLDNLTDARGLHLSPLDQVTPELGRRVMATVAVDH
ncbi:MAG: TonB-dependent receptor [Proteobacteria bacterium]|nr:TonB-dependent receptor [Pseudomonadota bacterium]